MRGFLSLSELQEEAERMNRSEAVERALLHPGEPVPVLDQARRMRGGRGDELPADSHYCSTECTQHSDPPVEPGYHKCAWCNETFDEAEEARGHVQQVHGVGPNLRAATTRELLLELSDRYPGARKVLNSFSRDLSPADLQYRAVDAG